MRPMKKQVITLALLTLPFCGQSQTARQIDSAAVYILERMEEVKIGDQTYVKFGDTYYQPIELDGEEAYEIVDVKEEEQSRVEYGRHI